MSADHNVLERRSGEPKRAFMIAYAAMAWCALVLQFYLLIARVLADGGTLVGATVTYFSFFTVLTNTVAALAVTVLLAPETRLGRSLAHPRVQSGIAAALALVGVAYELLLRRTWNPQGLQFVADVLLHDLMPASFMLYWALFVPKGSLRWQDVFSWLIYPATYLVYVLARGAASGQYPYHFLDVGALGYARTLESIVLLLGGFVLIGLTLAAVDRLLGRARSEAERVHHS